MKSLPISTQNIHLSRRGVELDPWLLYEEPTSPRKPNKKRDRDEFNLLTLRLSCPYPEYDFGYYSPQPCVHLIAVSPPISTKTIRVEKLKRQAEYFYIRIGEASTEPIYDYQQAKQTLFNMALKLKPYWITLKLTNIHVVTSAVGLENQKDFDKLCEKIYELQDFPILTEYVERFDADPEEFETQEEYNAHYLGKFRDFKIAGKFNKDEGYFEEIYLDIPDEMMDEEYARRRKENDLELEKLVSPIFEKFLSVIRISSTEDQIQKWLTKITDFSFKDKREAATAMERHNIIISNDRNYINLFYPTVIFSTGEMLFDDDSL